MKILHVNIGRARATQINGRAVLTAIHKTAAPGPVAVQAMGLVGDEQADLSVHGGLSKAVYAYPHEHYRFWQTVRAQAQVSLWDEPLAPGAMGENLTLLGVLEDQLFIGDRLRVGGTPDQPGCVLVVSEPRMPCFKLNAAMGFSKATRLMQQSGFCGSYLAVLQPGVVQAGDPVTLQAGPREVNLRELFLSRTKR